MVGAGRLSLPCRRGCLGAYTKAWGGCPGPLVPRRRPARRHCLSLALVARRRRAGKSAAPGSSGRSPPRVADTPVAALLSCVSAVCQQGSLRSSRGSRVLATGGYQGTSRLGAMRRASAALHLTGVRRRSRSVAPGARPPRSPGPSMPPSRRPSPDMPPNAIDAPRRRRRDPPAPVPRPRRRALPPKDQRRSTLRGRRSIGRRRLPAAGCWRLHAIQLRSAPRPRHQC